MSEDSYAARRAMRVAGAASESDGDDAVNAGDHVGAAPVQRPGQEPEDPTAQGKPGASTRQPRPKLTYELLTAPGGIPMVFGSFRDAFQKQRNGKSNVTRDLGLLLELYEQWQKQVFPHDDFDTFSKKVANLYGRPGGKMTKSATLKADMRQLRESVIELALEGMGDAPDTEPTMDEDGPAQGASTPPENEMASEAIADAVDRAAASHCNVVNFDAVAGELSTENAHGHKQRRKTETAAGHAASAVANAEIDDVEVDELMMAHAADEEFWEEDALEDMMVTA